MNVRALRRMGVDARLVVFNTHAAHPEADVDLRIPKGPSWRRQAAQFRALAKLDPGRDDVRVRHPADRVVGADDLCVRATAVRELGRALPADVRAEEVKDALAASRAQDRELQ